MKDQKGFSLTELIIFAGLILILIIFGIVLLNQEKAKTRDAKRITDITQIRYGFEILFNETNSYAEAAQGCPKKGALVSSCNLGQYLPGISKILDPGKNDYKITKVPDEEDFEVTFYLEKGYNGLTQGKHILSSTGIK